MPTLYSWFLTVPASAPVVLPDPGPLVQSSPIFGRKRQFERGIKFANVPGGDAKNVVHGGPRVWHVNSVQNVQSEPLRSVTTVNGSIRFRHRDYRKASIPSSVSNDRRGLDEFGNPVFERTGK